MADKRRARTEGVAFELRSMLALRPKNGTVSLEAAERPGGSEAIVRVRKSGICRTDIEIVKGYGGFQEILGHEFVGTVEQCAERPELEGKRVVGEINAGCGKCPLCAAGDPRHCPDRTVLGIKGRDGSHAEFLTLPAVNLLEVPDNVTDLQAVFAEPLAAAYGITEQVEIGSHTRVAVIGDGKLGLLCAFALAPIAPELMLIGKHSAKIGIASKRGIKGVRADRAALLANEFDVVIEASGSGSGFATALDLVKPRGKIVLKSTFHGRPTWEAWRVVVDEITIVGSRCGRFAPALEILADGFEVEDLVSEEFALDEGIAAFGAAETPGMLKVVLNMPD
jgi:threonine dehydrogenase-like Zn-dependent dehydrogenase